MTYSTPQPYAPVLIPRAPDGTKTNTLWIWLVVLLPVVQLVPLVFIKWGSLIDIASVTSVSGTALMTSPAYLLASFGGWIIYGLCALFAYLDGKQLKAAGVPAPFHFAWVFLSSIVYVIGRSVVVKRRTGRGTAPMWVAIATVVVSFGVASYITLTVVRAVMSRIIY